MHPPIRTVEEQLALLQARRPRKTKPPPEMGGGVAPGVALPGWGAIGEARPRFWRPGADAKSMRRTAGLRVSPCGSAARDRGPPRPRRTGRARRVRARNLR